MPAETCLICGYRLDGLPHAHQCPECGEAFDERTRAWMRPLKGVQSAGVRGAMIVVAIQIASNSGTLLAAGLAPRRLWMALSVWVLVGIGIYLAHRRWQRRVVAITPSGLLVREVLWTGRIPWEDLLDARVVEAIGTGWYLVLLHRDGHERRERRIRSTSDARGEVDDFSRAVLAAREEYLRRRQAADAPPLTSPRSR